MKSKSKKPEKIPCMVCGKPVRWGVNGCPVVKPGQEMIAVLMGQGIIGYKHYTCELINITQKI